ncbi:thiol-activated cytolysin family protein [Kribbella catacumbae]|uniref:thiol-activated cytolysin family protein n=1 Tax=Kribbella catacumbae TaxID=460086 RepID=UPI0003A061F2|nr:thiol-activated cytolysin family protein [Kribbella catacumbae]
MAGVMRTTVLNEAALAALRAQHEANPFIRQHGESAASANARTVFDVVVDAGRFAPRSSQDIPLGTTQRSVTRGGLSWVVTEQRWNKFNNLLSLSYLQDTATRVWPGQLLQAGPLTRGTTAEIPIAERAPGTLEITTNFKPKNKAAGPVRQYRHLERPSSASANEAVREILHAVDPDGSSGQVAADFERVHTIRETFLKLGVDVRAATYNVKLDASADVNLDSTTLMFWLRQVFYSVTFTPDSPPPGGLFTGKVKGGDLAPFTEPVNGGPPLYVSKVDVGRAMYITVKADTSRQELKLALEGGWGAVVAGGKAAFEGRAKEILERSEVRFYATGVMSMGAPFELLNPAEDLPRLINEGLKVSVDNPGEPISFSANYLLDNDVAAIGMFADYVEPVSATLPDYHTTLPIPVWDGVNGGTVATEILVAPGDKVEIIGSGRTSSGVFLGPDTGPNGWSGWLAPADWPLPGENVHCLTARFGDNDPFKVGDYWSGNSGSTAVERLVLGINDNDPSNGDPRKQFGATIHVYRGEPASARIYLA